MKKILSVILAMVITLSCASLFAASALVQPLGVWFGGEDVESIESDKAVAWWQAENGEYYFFVPSYWDASELKIFTNVEGEVKMGETVITSGETYDLGESGTITWSGNEYKYHVLSSSGIGTIFIQTESGSLDAIHADKSHAEKGNIYIYNAKGKSQTLDDDKNEDNELASIKGRGNATWQLPKRPYNIKLANKYKIFGMQKSKKWCLIANYEDETLMRNSVAFGAASDSGMPYTPESAPTDLYINGQYKGSYLLTSKIEASSKRIDVENLDDINEEVCQDAYGKDFDMDTLKRGGVYGRFSGLLENTYKYVELPESEKNTAVGGYILEMELGNRYADEISGFVTKNSQPIIMKEPEYASKEQMEFISDYYQRFEEAAISESGKNEKGEAYDELADLESLAKYYALSEWYENLDSGLTSTYFYLDSSKDGILYAGPVWDYDMAFGNFREKRFGIDFANPEEFAVCFNRQYRNTVFGKYDIDEKPTIFNILNQKQDFVAAVKEHWDSSIFEAVTAWSTDSFDEYAALIKDSAVMDHIRWNTYGTADSAAVAQKYDGNVAALKDFVTKRTAFLNANFGKVQENPHTTDFFTSLGKKILKGFNDLFEKIIVTFKLENI
ncbi:MAG: CotH kinase family protein [Clostridia bacterium]|nr:CotH kinase family protein [Clostridia bacterium]